MAIKSTIFKVELNISDMDRHYYNEHKITIARHPSETDERMVLRIAVFALHANEHLMFTKGLSTDEEPDLWQKSLSDEIDLWVELGQPDEKRLRQATGRAKEVVVYCYSSRSAKVWWQKIENKLSRFKNLSINHISDETVSQLAGLASRTMQLQCNIEDGVLWITDDENSVEVIVDKWKQTL